MEPNQVTNPFEFTDILGLIAPYLNATVTRHAGNRCLRQLWLSKGKVPIFAKSASFDGLKSISKYATSIEILNYPTDHFLAYLISTCFTNVTKLIIPYVCNEKDISSKNFPNLRILIIKTKLNWEEYTKKNFLALVEKIPTLEDINTNIALSYTVANHVTYSELFDIANKFTNIKLIFDNQLTTGAFLQYLSREKEKIAHYKIECPYIDDKNIQYMLINFCSDLRFKMDCIKIDQLIITINSLVRFLVEINLSGTHDRKRKIALILANVDTTDLATPNMNTLYASLGLSLRDLRNLNIDLSIVSSIQWFSELFKKLKK